MTIMDTGVVFSSLFLGIFQGFSEFLPISSSGHLVLLPWLFDFPDPGLAFDVALHAGTLIAVVGYFWRDWLNVFRFRHDMSDYADHPELLLYLVVATLPGVAVGLLFSRQAETIFREPLLVAGTLFVFGALLYGADVFGKKSRNFTSIGLWDTLAIGVAQAVAIVPGVSRSGITISVALARGLDRASAARFSFLLSTPIIFGAMVLHGKDLIAFAGNPVFAVGVLASAVSGYIAIKILLRFIERVSYRVFFWYRAALALGIVILSFTRV